MKEHLNYIKVGLVAIISLLGWLGLAAAVAGGGAYLVHLLPPHVGFAIGVSGAVLWAAWCIGYSKEHPD